MVSNELLVQKIRQLMPKAKLVYLFGSQADGSATLTSDIDIAVLLDQKIDPVIRFDLQQTLAINLKQDVDLVDLLSASTVLQNQVITHGECLYDGTAEQFKFEMQVMSMYQHLNEERAEILQDYMK